MVGLKSNAPKYFSWEETLTHTENRPLQQEGIC